MSEFRSNADPSASGDNTGARVVVTYVIVLYGSILATLAGLYWAATRLGDISTIPALCLVGLCGAIVLGTMLPITIRSLREAQKSGKNRIPLARILQVATAIGAAGLAAGLIFYGYVVPAMVTAVVAILMARR